MGVSGKTNKVSSENDGHDNNILIPSPPEGRREYLHAFQTNIFYLNSSHWKPLDLNNQINCQRKHN